MDSTSSFLPNMRSNDNLHPGHENTNNNSNDQQQGRLMGRNGVHTFY
uniref:Protein kinase n=1 Tax=Rhizophora mucronata TaxID=61149 RepID=A0A2P2L4F1_RHIMU